MTREYEYSKLKGRITEKLGNIKSFADKLGISSTALYNKLQNKVPFTQDEILVAMDQEVLDIEPNEISKYFFTKKVGKTPTED